MQLCSRLYRAGLTGGLLCISRSGVSLTHLLQPEMSKRLMQSCSRMYRAGLTDVLVSSAAPRTLASLGKSRSRICT